MNILLFSAFLLILILLIRYFASSEKQSGLKILTVFGIVIGISALCFNFIFDSNFGASTPVNIRTENLTNKNLKIYTIIFWNNEWNGKGNYVNYDTEIKPNEKSDFWFDNDNSNFWLVAKNENNEIEYLNVVTGIESEFDFKITEREIMESKNAEIAKKLTDVTDENKKIERFAIWANIILIGFLILSLIKIKTGGNTMYKP